MGQHGSTRIGRWLCTTMLLMTCIDSLSMAYVMYVLYGAFYYAFITCISCQLATLSSVKQQVLLFAANLFLATVLETVVTLILSSVEASTEAWFWTISGLQVMLVPAYVFSLWS